MFSSALFNSVNPIFILQFHLLNTSGLNAGPARHSTLLTPHECEHQNAPPPPPPPPLRAGGGEQVKSGSSVQRFLTLAAITVDPKLMLTLTVTTHHGLATHTGMSLPFLIIFIYFIFIFWCRVSWLGSYGICTDLCVPL